MGYTIFYSWQATLPNSTNRTFIEEALKRAAKAIGKDNTVQEAPRIDQGAGGVPGAPDIGTIILEKIDQADLFVCDLSIIGHLGGRTRRKKIPIPNSNVLFELGYAYHALGRKRIILLMNTIYGGPEALPFDLKTKRVLTYAMKEEDTDRASVRNPLADSLEAAIREIIKEIEVDRLKVLPPPEPSFLDAALEAVAQNRTDQDAKIRRYMADLTKELGQLAPAMETREPDLGELIVTTLNQTPSLVKGFATLAESIAIQNAKGSALALYKAFQGLLERYHHRQGASNFPEADLNFYTFLGHELFVTFIAYLMREDRWELIAEVLKQRIPLEWANRTGPSAISFNYIASFQHDPLLEDRNYRYDPSVRTRSLHANLLRERHRDGELADHPPYRDFVEADYLLFLRSELTRTGPDQKHEWLPRSAAFMGSQLPSYLVAAEDYSFAQRLASALGFQTVELLRERFAKKPSLKEVFGGIREDPLRNFDPASIGRHS